MLGLSALPGSQPVSRRVGLVCLQTQGLSKRPTPQALAPPAPLAAGIEPRQRAGIILCGLDASEAQELEWPSLWLAAIPIAKGKMVGVQGTTL